MAHPVSFDTCSSVSSVYSEPGGLRLSLTSSFSFTSKPGLNSSGDDDCFSNNNDLESIVMPTSPVHIMQAQIWKHRLSDRRQKLTDHLSSKIHESAKDGNLEAIKAVFKVAEEKLLCVDERSKTYRPKSTAIRDLFKAIADHKDATDYDSTPLLQAASRGHVDVVQYLAEEMLVDLQARRKDHTDSMAIHLAAENGHLGVVAYLLQFDKDLFLEAKTSYNETALNRAAYHGHFEIVEFLVDGHRAELNSRDTRNNWTPLMAAASRGNIPIVDFLIKCGADL